VKQNFSSYASLCILALSLLYATVYKKGLFHLILKCISNYVCYWLYDAGQGLHCFTSSDSQLDYAIAYL
jgi:hypothetical protein